MILLDDEDEDPSRLDLFNSILETSTSKFVGWVLMSVNSIGSNGVQQHFHTTFANYYLGLSRLGITINSKYGYGVPLTTFDNIRKSELAYSRRTAREKLLRPHVLWYDNFSKFRSHSIPTIRKDVFSECLWTGVTINEYTGPDVDTSLKYNGNNELINAMPSDVFEFKDKVHKQIFDAHGKDTEQFEDSFVYRYRVNNIPMKIDGKRFPHMDMIMNSAKNTAKFIHPYKLIKENIGSNEGLLNIMFELQTDHNMESDYKGPLQYINLNVDENIYYRILKVYIYIYTCIHIYIYLYFATLSLLLYLLQCMCMRTLYTYIYTYTYICMYMYIIHSVVFNIVNTYLCDYLSIFI
jgi:hypothetical protein